MGIKCPKCQSENPETATFCADCGTKITSPKDIGVTKTIETPVEEYPRGSTFADRYKIIEKLGIGGMGAVYRVEDTNIGQDIALKLIKSDIASDKKTIERFRNELKTTRMISHRNVCRMFDLAETENTYYITMEYVPGEDLKSFIRRSGKLDIPKAVSIAKEICEGLSEAHRLGVVHRDLKSNNIMIDKQGNARIMDFGIARSLRAKGLTGEGIIIGTPEYMSPEQAEANEVDQRTDIYSLGVILYEMVTGQLPFEGDTPLAVAMKHKEDMPIDPKELNAQIPDDLSWIILRCLEKDREKRYQSAEELLRELKKIETGVTPASDIYRHLSPTKSRRWNTLLLIGAAILAIAVATFLFFLLSGFGSRADPNIVVVISFTNKTGNSSLVHLGGMAADWTTQGLVNTGLMEVVPTSTVETVLGAYQRGDVINYMAKETGAGLVVSGSYYLDGDKILFQSQVTDATNGKVLRALDPVSGPANEPSKAIESMRLQLMAVLANIFEPLITEWGAVEGEPHSYEAYLEFLEGGKFFIRLEFRKALEHLHRALELDPDWTAPFFMAAVNHLNLGEYAEVEILTTKLNERREMLGPSDRIHLDWFQASNRGDRVGMYRASRQLVAMNPGTTWEYQVASDALSINRPKETIKALANLDPEQGLFKDWYPYWDRITSAHHRLGNHKQELKEAQRAREKYPDLQATLWYEVRALAALGKIEEINKLLDECLNLPPQRGWSPAGVMRLSVHELQVHGYKEEAIEIAERAISWYKVHKDQDNRPSLANTLYIAERWEEAQAIYEALHEEFPERVDNLGYLGTLAARMGNKENALRISDKLENIKRPYLFGNNTYWMACIAALLGEKEKAMKLLRDSLGQGVRYTRLYADMDLEPLFDYPPFKELIEPKG